MERFASFGGGAAYFIRQIYLGAAGQIVVGPSSSCCCEGGRRTHVGVAVVVAKKRSATVGGGLLGHSFFDGSAAKSTTLELTLVALIFAPRYAFLTHHWSTRG